LALVALKIKTINAMKANVKICHYLKHIEFKRQATGNDLAKKVAQYFPIMDCIQTFVLGYKKAKYESILKKQEEHLQTYFNEKILRDLIDPNVLSKLHVPPFNKNVWYIGYPDQYDEGIQCAFISMFQKNSRSIVPN
jgi:hypothetical protein